MANSRGKPPKYKNKEEIEEKIEQYFESCKGEPLRKGYGIFVLAQLFQLVINRIFCMVRTDSDTFAAVNAEFAVNESFSISYPDCFRRTPLDTVDAAFAQIGIQTDRMIKFIH